MGHTGVGWGVSWKGVVGHVGVGWVMEEWGGSWMGEVGCVMEGWGMCHVGVGWGVRCRGGWAVNNFICHKLGFLSFLLTNYQLLSG